MKTYAHFIFNDKTKVVISNSKENKDKIKIMIIDEFLNTVNIDAPKLDILKVEDGAVKEKIEKSDVKED